MLDEKGNKNYFRFGINKIATSFHQQIYESQQINPPFIALPPTSSIDPEPIFLTEEIEMVSNKLKNNKVGGEDKLTNEHFKYGSGTRLIQYSHILFNKIIFRTNGEFPILY